MSVKERKQFSLSEKTVTRIEMIANEKSESYSSVVEKAVEHYYKNMTEEERELEIILKNILEELKTLRVIGNVINKDTNIMLEFWNHFFVVNDYKQLITTEKYKTKELHEAEQLINDRIIKKRNKKLNREKTGAV